LTEQCGGVYCEPSQGKYILIRARGPKSFERTSRNGTGVILPTVYLNNNSMGFRLQKGLGVGT